LRRSGAEPNFDLPFCVLLIWVSARDGSSSDEPQQPAQKTLKEE
jgi:hypothetical protein